MALKSLQFIEIDTPFFDESGSPVGDQTWRFAVPTEYLPRDVDCIPSVASISYTPATISLGENLGERASVTITFKDHRHIMNGEPFEQGTFFGKWRARYGQKLRGRAVRWLNGLEGQALEDMPTRHFFIDSTDGPTVDGTYTIVCKDLLKFADSDRALAPVLSNGRLAAGISDTDVSAALLPNGIGNEEYPASGHLCFGGKEIVSFTRSGDNLTITRGQLGTAPIDHDASERAQLVLYYDGDDVADIINDLFVNYAAVDSGYIPLTDWQAETAANLSVIYARAITEPTAVGKLVAELVEQAALAVWWDELAQIVRLQVLKEIATDAVLWDEDKILQGSLKVKDQPDKRISQIWTYYGQRDPADRGDNEDNYRNALADVDLGRETEYGGSLIRKIMGSWVATENAAQRLNQVQMSRFRDPPRRFNFDLFPTATCLAGQGARIRWRQNQDVLGNIVEDGAPIQVTRVAVEAGVIHVEAEEMLASGVVVLTHTVILTAIGGVFNWTVPDDWNDANNSIHCIGGGGGGDDGGGSIFSAFGGGGGGGGAYSSITNLTLTPSGSVQYRVGAGGSASSAGGDSWFNGANLAASSVGAKAGLGSTGISGATGGQAAAGIGTVKFSGGNGGNGTISGGAGGGGGAAGPNGGGGSGGNNSGNQDGGAGGGGADGGGDGVGPSGDTGGRGGHNRFGSGGGTDGNPNGLDGGGGRGCNQADNNSGGIGSSTGVWTQTIAPIISAGPSGGAGGGHITGGGKNAALYGAAGGGGGGPNTSGGNGSQGVIVIIWTPA
jgi:hypothetical protein